MGGQRGRWVYRPLSHPARPWNGSGCISGPKAIAPVRQQLQDLPGSSLSSLLGALPSIVGFLHFLLNSFPVLLLSANPVLLRP